MQRRQRAVRQAQAAAQHTQHHVDGHGVCAAHKGSEERGVLVDH
jgi:hypothetical protein